MICIGCKLKNDHADANRPDGTYCCYDCRCSEKGFSAVSHETDWSCTLTAPPGWKPTTVVRQDNGYYTLTFSRDAL